MEKGKPGRVEGTVCGSVVMWSGRHLRKTRGK